MDPISKRLAEHYEATFREHGATSRGVDWGADQNRLALRYDRMLDVARGVLDPDWSVLDVGCGFGGLLEHAQARGISPTYHGIDMSESMLDWGRKRFPEARFDCSDVLAMAGENAFDFVICNGILTQKLDTPGLEMDAYANRIIRQLFKLARKGAAFNVMSTKVNFFAENLYYRNPAELLAWCITDITPHVRLDHSYPLYEFTVYLYKAPQ
jgi:2-polyprenyl-3-methyl-5-hydroxy-6-metoxy-1,4-benzoquinol methylase